MTRFWKWAGRHEFAIECAAFFLIAINFCIFLGPCNVAGDDTVWRPGVWRESEKDWEARQPPPVCEERRIALVGDSLMQGKWFISYLHDLWVQYGDWYEWDDRFSGNKEPDIYVEGYFRKGAGVSNINEMLREALYGDFRPTHVVVYGGINDCARYGHSPEANAAYIIQALEAFIERIQERGVKPIVMQHHPWRGSKYDKKGKGWECSAIVNDWIWGEQLMAGDGAQIVWTGSLGSCGGMDDGERQCDCVEYIFGRVSDEQCAGRSILDKDNDAGDGLHLSRMGQASLASSIHSYLRW